MPSSLTAPDLSLKQVVRKAAVPESSTATAHCLYVEAEQRKLRII